MKEGLSSDIENQRLELIDPLHTKQELIEYVSPYTICNYTGYDL